MPRKPGVKNAPAILSQSVLANGRVALRIAEPTGDPRAVLRRVWDEIVDSDWQGYTSRDHEHKQPICLMCRAEITYHYHSPNEFGGKTFLGHTCSHAPDCLVPLVEQTLGIVPFVPSDGLDSEAEAGHE